jgi:segregation and condensation protein B
MGKKKSSKSKGEEAVAATDDVVAIEAAAPETEAEVNFELDGKSFTEQVFEGLLSESFADASTDSADDESSELDELGGDLASAVEAEAAIEGEVDGESSADIQVAADVQDTELADFDSAEIEDIEEISQDELMSAVESLLFASDRPQSAAVLKAAFQGTKVRVADIRAAVERLQIEYSNASRGVVIDEVAGGYQIRTKPSNQKYLVRTVKARPFRLSGPALEVLAIVAYKQPCTKSMVDEIRGVESGHLMRGLLDRGLIHFAGKSELPGRPMSYETTRKFLEIFNLRNIQELPTLNEIDQLIPEGIGDEAEKKPELKDITGALSAEVQTQSYSVGEEELVDISSELKAIETTTAFFEEEKVRQRQKRDADRAQDLRERLTVGEIVEDKDRRWLEKYEAELAQAATAKAAAEATATEVSVTAEVTVTPQMTTETQGEIPRESVVEAEPV